MNEFVLRYITIRNLYSFVFFPEFLCFTALIKHEKIEYFASAAKHLIPSCCLPRFKGRSS